MSRAGSLPGQATLGQTTLKTVWGRWLGQGALPSTRFVLFGAPRCGKSVLLELLQSCEALTCDRNLLSHRSFFPLWHIHHHALRAQADLYGFQLSSQDLLTSQGLGEPGRFLQVLHDQGYRIIHLHRQDMMRHAIALLKAQQPIDVHTLKRQPIEVCPTALVQQLTQLEQQRLEETAMLTEVSHLRITYETDLLDPNRHAHTVGQLNDFLGTHWQPQNQTTLRPNIRLVHQKISDLIINYDEVRQAVAQSDYPYVLSAQTMQLAI